MSTQSSLYAISKILDLVVFGLLATFFIGVLAFDIAYFGFHEAIIPIPHEAEPYFEVLAWAILCLLLADIYVKYRKLDSDWRALLRHHWLDVIMAILIPIFMPLKFVKLVKALKTAKSGVKIIQKARRDFYVNPRVGRLRLNSVAPQQEDIASDICQYF